MKQDDRDGLARVVRTWKDWPVVAENCIAANLNAVLAFVPADEIRLRKAAEENPTRAADFLLAAQLVHGFLAVGE